MTDLVRKPKTLTTAKVATRKGQVTFSASGVRYLAEAQTELAAMIRNSR
jgi:hypothetical protein